MAKRYSALPLIILGIIITNIDNVIARDDGLLKPPLGWMSWEVFGCERDCINYPDSCVSERNILAQGEALVSKGLKDVGFQYINIDDCYLEKRGTPTQKSPRGDLQADTERFPSGLAKLGDELHKLGLKFGVYNDIGQTTCASNPGLNISATDDEVADMQLQRDVEVMARDWEIDSIKVDGCAVDKVQNPMNITYPKLSKFLNNSGRQILFTCSWPVYIQNLTATMDLLPGALDVVPWKSVEKHCSTWRVYKDIMDAFDLKGHAGIIEIIGVWEKFNETLRNTQKRGAYHDPDMLMVGNPGLSVEEARIQFTMWSMWSAPLLLSTDLRKIDNSMIDILTNQEIISIDQDDSDMAKPLVLGTVELDGAEVTQWTRTLSDNSIAVAVLNLGVFEGQHFNATITASSLGLPPESHFSLRDLWSKQNIPGKYNQYSVLTDATTVRAFKAYRVS